MVISKDRLPDVSIVIPNWNGLHHLEPCFESLNTLAYPGHVELILVDNGSKDGSVEFMRRRFPRVQVVQNPINMGFASACNQGADVARTPIVAFMNNDMRVDPGWLIELVRPIADGKARCTGSLILNWDGTEVNYAGGAMNFHGIGVQVGMNDVDVGKYKAAQPTLFACGGAMAIDRELFLHCGGFDDDFFAYYEDVDLGWRLWVLGETVQYVPSSVIYHHHSATSRRVDVHRIRLLQIRNPLFSIFKNYDDDNVLRALPAALLLTMRRTKYLLNVEESEFSLAQNRGLKKGPFGGLRVRAAGKLSRGNVPLAGIADVLAINEFSAQISKFAAKRKWIQDRRKRSDKEILALFKEPFWPAERPEEYSTLQSDLADFFGLKELFPGTRGQGGAKVPPSGPASGKGAR